MSSIQTKFYQNKNTIYARMSKFFTGYNYFLNMVGRSLYRARKYKQSTLPLIMFFEWENQDTFQIEYLLHQEYLDFRRKVAEVFKVLSTKLINR